jgi:hypothetical protein
MTFTVGFKRKFAFEYEQRLGKADRTAINVFIATFVQHGLADQTRYVGRVSPSWMNIPTDHPNYKYAQENHLWHYHIGIPKYQGAQAWGKTSDWILHFQWQDRGDRVELVDLYAHHDQDGKFRLPTADYLEDDPAAAAPEPIAQPPDPPSV